MRLEIINRLDDIVIKSKGLFQKPKLFKRLIQAIFCNGGTDHVSVLLQRFTTVCHAYAIAHRTDHLQIIHAVAEADGILQTDAEEITHLSHGCSLVEFDQLDLTVDEASGNRILDAEAEGVGQQGQRLIQLLTPFTGEYHLVYGFPLPLSQR